MNIGVNKALLAAACVGMSLAVLGCAEKGPAVFDKAAIDQVDKLLVLPLQSPQDVSAGPIACGIIASRLQAGRYGRLSVIESPVLYRLAGAKKPEAAGVSDQAAARIAAELGADAVLTGTANFTSEFVTDKSMPEGMKKAMGDPKFQQDFAPRMGTVSLNVQIFSLKANRPVYAYNGQAQGAPGSEILSKAGAAALEPLERYLKDSRKR